MPVNVEKLKQKVQALRSDRSQEEVVWDEIEKYVMPLSGQTSAEIDGGSAQQKTDVKLWDLTAPLALEHMAASLHGDVTSASARWLDLEWQDPELEADHEAVAYRERLAEIVWSELQASDFNTEIGSGYLEWAGLGNMCLVTEPLAPEGEWRGLDFTAVPIRQVLFEEDSKGLVFRWFRLLRWTPIQMADHLERQGAPVPEWLRQLAEKPEAATLKREVVFAIYRRSEIAEDPDGPRRPELRPWGSCYFDLERCELLGEEGGYYRMPVVMAPWAQRPGSPWGFGRGHVVLRHVKWLNAFKELQRNAAEKAVDPAFGVTERVGDALDLRPGKVTVVPSREDVFPLEGAARFDVSVEVLRDERIEVRRAFHEDDLMLKESPAMTATEVQARKDQMNRAIGGGPAGRLQTKGLAPVVLIVLDLLARAQKLPPPPEIVKRKRPEVKLRFRGPIARAQLMDEVVAIEREAAFVANLLKLGFTEARHYFSLEDAIREHSKRLGVPAKVLKSPAEARKAVEGERRMLAEAQAAETAKAQGQALAAASSAGVSVGVGEQPPLLPSGGVPA